MVLRENPLFCYTVRLGSGQREGPVLLCGEAEQGLPGTVGWGSWAHKGLVDGDQGWESSTQKGWMVSEHAISSQEVKAAMSRLGNEQRRTREKQKLVYS